MNRPSFSFTCLIVLPLLLLTIPALGQVTHPPALAGPFIDAKGGLASTNQYDTDYAISLGVGASGGYSFGKVAVYGGIHRSSFTSDASENIFEFTPQDYTSTQYELVIRGQAPGLLEAYPALVPIADLGIVKMKSTYDDGVFVLSGSGFLVGLGAKYFVHPKIALSVEVTMMSGAYGKVTFDELSIDVGDLLGDDISDQPIFMTVGISLHPLEK